MTELFGPKWTSARLTLRQGALNNGYTYDTQSTMDVLSVCEHQHSDGVCPKEGIFLKMRFYLDKNGSDVFQEEEVRDQIDKKIGEFCQQILQRWKDEESLPLPPRNDRPEAATISPQKNDNTSDSVSTSNGEADATSSSQNDTTPMDNQQKRY